MKHGTRWDLPEHSQGKLTLLQKYFKLWLPILATYNPVLRYIDGFAGPGVYLGGEAGSPRIAYDCALALKENEKFSDVKVEFLFFESDSKRCDSLQSEFQSSNEFEDIVIEIQNIEFANGLKRVLTDGSMHSHVPTFLFVDPFGVKGVPLNLIGDFLKRDKSECLISFMWEDMKRWNTHDAFQPHLDSLFGTTKWREFGENLNAIQKRVEIHELFKSQLKRVGATYVLQFMIWRGNSHLYTLYFATNHLKGCEKMKECIWTVDNTGSYSFQGLYNQAPLKGMIEDGLYQELRTKFGNRKVSVDVIDRFLQSDETIYISNLS